MTFDPTIYCNTEACDGEPCNNPAAHTQQVAPKAVPTVTEQYAAMGETHTGAFPTFPTKAARTAFFRGALGHNAPFTRRALLVIYAMQTADEQASETTTASNGVGFSGFDAELLTSFAKQLETKQDKYPGKPEWWLSEKQMKWVFKKMPKYANQLVRLLEQRTDADGNPAPVPGIEVVKVKQGKEARAA